jgi:hypothetical protein
MAPNADDVPQLIPEYNSTPHVGLPIVQCTRSVGRMTPREIWADTSYHWRSGVAPNWIVDGVSVRLSEQTPLIKWYIFLACYVPIGATANGDNFLDAIEPFVGAQKIHSHPKSYPHVSWIYYVNDYGCRWFQTLFGVQTNDASVNDSSILEGRKECPARALPLPSGATSGLAAKRYSRKTRDSAISLEASVNPHFSLHKKFTLPFPWRQFILPCHFLFSGRTGTAQVGGVSLNQKEILLMILSRNIKTCDAPDGGSINVIDVESQTSEATRQMDRKSRVVSSWISMFSSPKLAAAQSWRSFLLRPKFPYRFRRLLANIPNYYS